MILEGKGKELISVFRKFVDLPESGYIAGGARALELLLRHHLNGTLDEKVLPELSVILNGIDSDVRLADDREPTQEEIMAEEKREVEYETMSIINVGECLEAFDDIEHFKVIYRPGKKLFGTRKEKI